MIKKYQSKSCISLSVLLENGKSVHVSFDGLTGGGSVFYTDNEVLQSALAKHPKYGRLFKEVELVAASQEENPKKKKSKKFSVDPVVLEKEDIETEDAGEGIEECDVEEDTTEGNDSTDTKETSTDDKEEDETDAEYETAKGKQIHVSCWEDAKNYLADTYGISRTKIRSQKLIKEAAEAHGIVFVGIQ